MILQNYPENKLKSEIKGLVGKYLDLNKHQLIIFGSRVNGKASRWSDIDVGILGSNTISSSAIGKIKDGLEEMPILYKIDIVDFAGADQKFKSVALQNYEQI
ncbi:MAG: Nucleotidyltransferase [Candidatus Amesbacteria bacterium GW2011_GWA2_42_12]|uniref:Nucleotidyltransferase n=1 Tax=Candidatus Amesbacteria bacterium GW2011_GWA2_42_12 TaxID=1618356 RepID=A0A0G0Y6A9_9BACT|nr:MAG: Nucleotidyltransferase [Candidatus Amesbacteria bacterium GW2011_GWA2_42_12]